MTISKLFEKIILISLFIILVLSKISAQTFEFNLQTSPLTFDYTTNANFTTPRNISRAFTISINNSKRGKYNLSCKIIPNSNTYSDIAPQNLFAMKVNSANFTIAGSYYQSLTLGLSNVLVANVTGRASKNDTIYFDLILNPLDLTIPPANYNYSFVFTVTEY
jgi:hypothetical protein